jgi:hypothetical protein
MPTSDEQDYFRAAHEQYHQLIKTLSAEPSQGWEHGEVERYINEGGTELLRRLFQGHLDLRYRVILTYAMPKKSTKPK